MKKMKLTGLIKDMSPIGHFIKLANRILPSYIPLAVGAAVLRAVAPFLNIIMPKYLLNELNAFQRIEKLALYVGILIVGNAVLSFTNSIVENRLQIFGERLADGFELHVGKHIMHMDFEKLEDAKILDMKEKALFNMRLHNALLEGPKTIISLFELLIRWIGLLSIIAILSPWLIAIMVLLIVVRALIYKRMQTTKFGFYKDIAVFNRQFMYFRNLTQDFNNAKDVRIYNMWAYIIDRINNYQKCVNNVFQKMFLRQRKLDGYSAVNIQVLIIITYICAVWNFSRGFIRIGDFTMYISAATQFSDVTSNLMMKMVDLQMLSNVMRDYLDFEQLPNRNTYGKEAMKEMRDITIEFRNVWFKYPNASDFCLKDVSLTIQNGEKLSIVGRNGAGKTTFIKLLCRLYCPDKGAILLNGININAFEDAEYRKLLSVIFQDYKLFSCSVEENITLGEPSEEKRIRDVLEQVGIRRKVEKLPLGIHTMLNKSFDNTGEALSGGEMQRIALARLLYKNTPLIILDEPTAALDPYSEYEIYSQFNRIANGKTTVFISHRLSSCRFCDKIAVFDNGTLVEYGNHDQLVADGKLYSEMWKAQAQYYHVNL